MEDGGNLKESYQDGEGVQKEEPGEPGVSGESGEIKPEELVELKKQLDEERRLKEQYLSGWQRAQADFENYRKRVKVEREDLFSTISEGVIQRLLPIVDNLERALDAAKNGSGGASLIEGVSLVLKQLTDFLDKEGVTPIPTLGQPFDPKLHEAIMQVETTEAREDIIIEEVQKGYRSKARVIRPSLVKVAKAPADVNSGCIQEGDLIHE